MVAVEVLHPHPGPPPRDEDHHVEAWADPRGLRELSGVGTVAKTSVLEAWRIPKEVSPYRKKRGARISFFCYPVDESIQHVKHGEFDFRPNRSIIRICRTVDTGQHWIFLKF